jgi:hypothetical protein
MRMDRILAGVVLAAMEKWDWVLAIAAIVVIALLLVVRLAKKKAPEAEEEGVGEAPAEDTSEE